MSYSKLNEGNVRDVREYVTFAQSDLKMNVINEFLLEQIGGNIDCLGRSTVLVVQTNVFGGVNLD